MQTTLLSLQDSLPLTCSRAGTCCHGNLVRLNPWELARLAQAKSMLVKDFREKNTLAGGSILNFNGKLNHIGKSSCGLYLEGAGCSVHPDRPLACRLFPLGRQIQNEQAQYIFEGTQFPCFNECPEVVDLPHLTVENYLAGQETKAFEDAQDEYLEVMQNLADIAFSLLLDTGLAESGDTNTVSAWRRFGTMSVDSLLKHISSEWQELLTVPDLNNHIENSIIFARSHNEIIQTKAQESFGALVTLEAVQKAAESVMVMALFYAHALGADTNGLAEHWIEIAKSNGAGE